MREEIIRIGSRSLVGVVTKPSAETDPSRPAVLLLNSGLIHRASPNRIYVKLARRLADLGFFVLRFDFSGIGDSPERRDRTPFDQAAVSETVEAMDHLEKIVDARRFVAGGICAGARIAFKAAARDPRIAGAFLLNTAIFSDGLGDALRAREERSRWRRVLGSSHGTKGRGVSEAEVVVSGLQTLRDRSVSLLVVYSEWEKRLERLRQSGLEPEDLRAFGSVQVDIVPRSDHTFTPLESQKRLTTLLEKWILELDPEESP